MMIIISPCSRKLRLPVKVNYCDQKSWVKISHSHELYQLYFIETDRISYNNLQNWYWKYISNGRQKSRIDFRDPLRLDLLHDIDTRKVIRLDGYREAFSTYYRTHQTPYRIYTIACSSSLLCVYAHMYTKKLFPTFVYWRTSSPLINRTFGSVAYLSNYSIHYICD